MNGGPSGKSLFKESFRRQLFNKTCVKNIFHPKRSHLGISWSQHIKDKLKAFLRRQWNFLINVVLDVLPLTLQQLHVRISQIARCDCNRLFFVLLKKSNPSHISSDQREHGVAVGLGVSSRRKYCGKWEFDAEIDEIQNLVEARAAADESRATDGGGIDGTDPKRGEPLRRSSSDQHGGLLLIDAQVPESDARGDFVRPTDSTDTDFLAGQIGGALYRLARHEGVVQTVHRNCHDNRVFARGPCPNWTRGPRDAGLNLSRQKRLHPPYVPLNVGYLDFNSLLSE